MRRLLGAIATLILATMPTHAERVMVQGVTGEHGHAWLFGSAGQGKGQCWLAVPAHVIVDHTGTLQPFTFADKRMRAGQSAGPISVVAVEGAQAAAGGVDDLAFARVAVGPADGSCLSRLGLPEYAYDAALDSAPRLTVESFVETSFVSFDMLVTRAVRNDSGGGLMNLEPVDPKEGEDYLKAGLSGSVATLARDSGVVPFAMILRVDAKGGFARALRFDLIRNAFSLVEADVLSKSRSARAEDGGVPYEIRGFEGTSQEGGPAGLGDSATCWHVAPLGGKQQVTVSVELADKGDVLRGLTMVAAPGCGEAGGKIYVDQRRNDDALWSVARDCEVAAALDTTPQCRFELDGPRQLRLRIVATAPIGLTQLRLY